MEALITGLALAAVTGLAWFAYNHPKQFSPLALILKWTTTTILTLACTWSVAANQAFVVMLPYIEDNEKARDAVRAMTMDWLWGPIAALAVLGYLQFLDVVVTTLKDRGD